MGAGQNEQRLHSTGAPWAGGSVPPDEFAVSGVESAHEKVETVMKTQASTGL